MESCPQQEQKELEQQVDEMFIRTDKLIFEVLDKILQEVRQKAVDET